MKRLRIGAGSAWWGDRVGPAAELAERGGLDYLFFETMAEATISAAQVRQRAEPSFAGYDTYFDQRMRAVLPGCARNGTKIVTNQGWINPEGARQRCLELAEELGLHSLRVAAVLGGIVTDRLDRLVGPLLESGAPLDTLRDSVVSAEAYLGAEPIVAALRQGADVVITSRVADPSLTLAPLIHAFGWALDDWPRLGAGTCLGHLLECAGQVTGGYFADPGYKEVPNVERLGYPLAEVEPSGEAVITKLPEAGGLVSPATCTEQLLYEVHDPARYLTPDVTADFSGVRFEQVGPDRVRVSGATGTARPPTLKVSIGCLEGYLAEDIFFYAGPGALARGRLAERMLRARLAEAKLEAEALRVDFIGYNSVHGEATPAWAPEPYEVGVRIAARTRSRAEAEKVGREVDAIAVGGPAATGKRIPFGSRVREVVGVWSGLIPREAVETRIVI
jgi:hypothetical protein